MGWPQPGLTLTLALLIGSGLILKSVARLSGVDPGFRGERVRTMRIDPVYKPPAGVISAVPFDQQRHDCLQRNSALS
jgi:hypothetical protein